MQNRLDPFRERAHGFSTFLCILGRLADRVRCSDRIWGRKLARRTLDLFRRLSDTPEQDFLKLSLELNRAPIDWREKNRFVNALALLLPPEDGLTPWDCFDGQHAVVEYLRDGDLRKFMECVHQNVTSGS